MTSFTTDPNTDLFYSKAKDYWAGIDATLNGVLGGYGFIADADARGSNNFLIRILKESNCPQWERALDCGAGIGRVTKDVLLNHFDTIDMVEFNGSFLDEAKKTFAGNPKIGHYFESSLQNFEPSEQYDVVWCQWVLGHLTDNDLVEFLKRCGKALRKGGLIIVKENISVEGPIMDETDSSVTRPAKEFNKIFRLAGLKVIRQATQTNFPRQLFSVKFFALTSVGNLSSK